MGQLPKILGLLFVLQFDKAQGELLCPPPFRQRGSECLFIHDDISEALNWDESSQRCLDLGGDLAQPRDMVDFVKYINEEYPILKSPIWLGATDRQEEGQWKWLSGESVPSAFWKIGREFNYKSEPSGDGNCMNIFYKNGYLVNDAPCTSRSHYACEIVIETVQQYISTYQSESPDEEELFQNLTERTGIIKENLKAIEDHNQLYTNGTITYKQAPNRYSLLTYLEVQSKITGVNVRNTSDIHPRYEPINLGNEPPSHNWIDEGAVNPIQNQGYCNSGWSFSAISVIESQIQIKTKVLQKLSEQYLLDCDKGEHNHGCRGGWPSFAINHVIKHGIALASGYNYTHTDGTCNTAAPKTNYNVTKSQELIEPGNDAALKNANFNKGPISVCIHAPASFEHYSEGIYVDAACESDNEVNHCVALVGYGTEKYANGSEHKYWLLRNSLGTSWGENGYMRMSRKKLNYCQISSHGAFPVYTEGVENEVSDLPEPGQVAVEDEV